LPFTGRYPKVEHSRTRYRRLPSHCSASGAGGRFSVGGRPKWPNQSAVGRQNIRRRRPRRLASLSVWAQSRLAFVCRPPLTGRHLFKGFFKRCCIVSVVVDAPFHRTRPIRRLCFSVKDRSVLRFREASGVARYDVPALPRRGTFFVFSPLIRAS